ncbi:hypothetical protein Pla108_15470 [Botrimarina colliarenosi]|uniref:Autotransporter-associated beta strand repeat protein n=1 Tax=Botrimarina colliarenosi TaxID=2528001 RepID=A0A5C6AKP4_9BACT|nr:hypothetical protein [Botrimarina colliarenosi]TWU00595.1 hypothetical protein Pla108_15470 [Botrimarina colliarenosi]
MPITLLRIAPVAGLLFTVATVSAEVLFTGTVAPGDPAAVDSSTTVTIGAADDFLPDADPRGGVEVNGGSQFVAGRVLVGDSAAALAKMVVTGDQTKATIGPGGSVNSPSLFVGANGSGYLRVDDGAWLQVGSGPYGVLSIGGGDDSAGIRSAEVVGDSSLVTIGRQLFVGDGPSSLSVRDGAVVRVGSLSNVLEDTVLIHGEVELAGARTELQTNGLTIGYRDPSIPYANFGTLRIDEGAIVRSMEGRGNSRAYVGYSGSLELDGGVFAISQLSLEGRLSGSGEVVGSVNVNFAGKIEVG